VLKKDEAERRAAEILAREQAGRPLHAGPRVWFMGFWRKICPGLDRLPPNGARAIAHQAMLESGRNRIFRGMALVVPAILVLVNDSVRVPPWSLLAFLVLPAAYIRLVRRAIARRLPEALAGGVEVRQV
jgi:hypothetical protein